MQKTKWLALLLLLISGYCYAGENGDSSEIKIYSELDPSLYGRSLNRNVITTIKNEQFKQSETFYLQNDTSSLVTAVTLSKSVANKINKHVKEGSSLMIGEYEISVDLVAQNVLKKEQVYRVQSRRSGLDVSFSIQKAPEDVLKMVEVFYQDLPITQALVLAYYRENYVLAIHSAENVFASWNKEVTLADVMVVATLLGDKEQLLWGVHDGNGLLANLTKNLYE